MSAAPNAVSEFQIVGVEDVDLTIVDVVDALTVRPNATSPAIASNFRIMKMFCVVLPARTPRQLMSVRRARAIVAKTAATLSLVSRFPSAQTYFANVTATAAMPPL